MKKNFKFWMILLSVALSLTSCVDSIDNPVSPTPADPETPAQKAFWAQFDGWQTDSCTVGDDFYMHMIGSWWKNPQDIYPKGLLTYAEEFNTQRVDEIYQSNPNLQHLVSNAKKGLTLSEEEVETIANAKVEELWAGATTREEALAALGRAWAEGYTLLFEPTVFLIDGVPTWKLGLKIPSYLPQDQLFKSKEDMWRKLAPRKKARKMTRGTLDEDLEIIVNAMNIKMDNIEIDDEAEDQLQNAFETKWTTVEDIKEDIRSTVYLMDGVLVNDACVAKYNEYLNEFSTLLGEAKEFNVTKENIAENVVKYMANIYTLNDYNRLYITPTMRQKYTEWCELFRTTMRKRLMDNQWLEEATRQNAIEKLDNIVFFVGGISVIPDCVIPTLTGSNLIEDVRQLRQARMDGYHWVTTQKRDVGAILLNNLLYFSDATIDNASYMFAYNIVNINPSNLCAPYVQDEYEDALQWAFVGTTVGHELIHGFDSNGSQYDLWGNQENWWTEADAAKFQAMCDQLTERYNELQLMPWADPTLYGDGEKTLAENIADLGGCCIALQILLDLHPNATDAEKKALTQRFFQGWAIQWSNTYNLKFLEFAKASDEHSQARERTNGVVRNMDEWYDAYDVKSGSLYLQPDKRVHIW